MDALTFRHMKI